MIIDKDIVEVLKSSTCLYTVLTKFGISQSVFHKFTCSFAKLKEVIRGYKRPVQTGPDWSKRTGLFAVFDFEKHKTRTAVQSFSSLVWSGPSLFAVQRQDFQTLVYVDTSCPPVPLSFGLRRGATL